MCPLLAIPPPAAERQAWCLGVTLRARSPAIRAAQAYGTLRPGFSADDLERIFSVNAYLVRARPAGDDGWRRTLQFTFDRLRAWPYSTSE